MNGELILQIAILSWSGVNLVRRVWRSLDGEAVWIVAFVFSLALSYLFSLTVSSLPVWETAFSAFLLATGGDTGLKRFLSKPEERSSEPLKEVEQGVKNLQEEVENLRREIQTRMKMF